MNSPSSYIFVSESDLLKARTPRYLFFFFPFLCYFKSFILILILKNSDLVNLRDNVCGGRFPSSRPKAHTELDGVKCSLIAM